MGELVGTVVGVVGSGVGKIEVGDSHGFTCFASRLLCRATPAVTSTPINSVKMVVAMHRFFLRTGESTAQPPRVASPSILPFGNVVVAFDVYVAEQVKVFDTNDLSSPWPSPTKITLSGTRM